MESRKPIYFNNSQRLTQLIGANISVIVAGRRTGKTDSIAAPFVLRNLSLNLLISNMSFHFNFLLADNLR